MFQNPWKTNKKACYSIKQELNGHNMFVCVCVYIPTNHAINSSKKHRALGGSWAFTQVLQHQWAMTEDIDKFPKVEDPNLLQVLSFLIRGSSTDGWRKSMKRRFTNMGRSVCENKRGKKCQMEDKIKCLGQEWSINRRKTRGQDILEVAKGQWMMER